MYAVHGVHLCVCCVLDREVKVLMADNSVSSVKILTSSHRHEMF